MISLIKIRLTYIKRHYCKCFFNYFAAGSVLLIYLILDLIFIERHRDLQEDFDPKFISVYPSFNTKDMFPNITKIGIISEDEKIFNEFKKIIEKEYSQFIKLEYFKKETDILKYGDYFTIIEIRKIKEKAYQFKIKNDNISIYKSISDEESQLIIPSNPFYGENIILDVNAFYIHKFLFYYYNINKKNYTVYSYPMKSIYNYTYFDISISYIYPIMISMIYGIIFLSFSLRMIDEKEKKLDILLNRYGIKTNQYYFSWLLTYIILTSFTTISIIIFFSYLTFIKLDIFLIFFIISQILFSLGIFSIAFFTQTVVSTLKTGQTLFKLLFFGIGVLAIVVIILDTPKYIKLFFFIFPHISHIQNLQIIYLLQIFEKVEFKSFFYTYHKINLIGSFFLLLIDIIIYLLEEF